MVSKDDKKNPNSTFQFPSVTIKHELVDQVDRSQEGESWGEWVSWMRMYAWEGIIAYQYLHDSIDAGLVDKYYGFAIDEKAINSIRAALNIEIENLICQGYLPSSFHKRWKLQIVADGSSLQMSFVRNR